MAMRELDMQGRWCSSLECSFKIYRRNRGAKTYVFVTGGMFHSTLFNDPAEWISRNVPILFGRSHTDTGRMTKLY